MSTTNNNRDPHKTYSARTARSSTPMASSPQQRATRVGQAGALAIMMRSVSMSSVIITESPMEKAATQAPQAASEIEPCQRATGTRSSPITPMGSHAPHGSGAKAPLRARVSNMKENCILLPGSAFEDSHCFEEDACPCDDLDPSTVLNTVTSMGYSPCGGAGPHPHPHRNNSLRSTGGSTTRPSSQVMYASSSMRSTGTSLQRFSNKSSLDGREWVSIPEAPSYSTSFTVGRGEGCSHHTLPPDPASPTTALPRRAYSYGDIGLCAPASPPSPALTLSPGPHHSDNTRPGTPTLVTAVEGQLRKSCQRLSAPSASNSLHARSRRREPPQGLSLTGRTHAMDRSSAHALQFSSRMDRASSVLDLLLGILPREGSGSGSGSTLLRLRRLRRGTVAAVAAAAGGGGMVGGSGGGAVPPTPRLLAGHQGSVEQERVEVESFLRHMEELRRENNTLKATLHSQTSSLEELQSMRLQLRELQQQLSKQQLQEPVARVSAAAGPDPAAPLEATGPVAVPRRLWDCMWSCHKASCKV